MFEKQMTNSIDRQGVLDNLTAIETTAKLLVNAFVKKNNDTELSLHGIHREELIHQTTTFLSQAQKLILNLAQTYNLTVDGYQKPKSILNEQSTANVPLIKEENEIATNNSPSKQIYSLSSVTLDDIIENRLTPKHLIPNYPLLHDPIQPNLVALARNIRQIENLDDIMLKIYSKIFNHEERICCNYDGINGKLPYPRHKRLLFDSMFKLTLNERQKIVDSNELHHFYTQCEKHFSHDTSLTKYRGLNLDQINSITDEEQFISSLFRLVISPDEIKKIRTAKQTGNDNELSLYHARPIHLLWIKQKWLERYPLHDDTSEGQRWSQCIDWAMNSFLQTIKIRPSKRKTMDVSTDHKRSKSSFTFEERIEQIDRTKFDALEYAIELVRLIFDENQKNLPTFEQLQLIEHRLFRYYWTKDPEKLWTNLLNFIDESFQNDYCRENYYQNLLQINPNEQKEIERLLQMTISE